MKKAIGEVREGKKPTLRRELVVGSRSKARADRRTILAAGNPKGRLYKLAGQVSNPKYLASSRTCTKPYTRSLQTDWPVEGSSAISSPPNG
jgi:hypothetical protein